MDATVHEVNKITTKVKRLSSSGTQVVTIFIETKYGEHEIVCFGGFDDIDWQGVVK
jgi:hypothetical protein